MIVIVTFLREYFKVGVTEGQSFFEDALPVNPEMARFIQAQQSSRVSDKGVLELPCTCVLELLKDICSEMYFFLPEEISHMIDCKTEANESTKMSTNIPDETL